MWGQEVGYEDLFIGSKQTARSQVTDCFFGKYAKEILKQEQRAVRRRMRWKAAEEGSVRRQCRRSCKRVGSEAGLTSKKLVEEGDVKATEEDE